MITIQLPIAGTTGFSDNQDHNLGHRICVCGNGIKAEVFALIQILLALCLTLYGQTEVVAHVDGEKVVIHFPFASTTGIDRHGYGVCQDYGASYPLFAKERGGQFCFTGNIYGGLYESGEVYNHHCHNGWIYLRKHFSHFCRAAGGEVQPHIHGNYTFAKEI